MAPAKATKWPAKAASPGSSSAKYQVQYTNTSAPTPATTSTITHCSDPIPNARSRPRVGTQATASVCTAESATAPLPATAHATAAAGTSASSRKARLPRALTSVGTPGQPTQRGLSAFPSLVPQCQTPMKGRGVYSPSGVGMPGRAVMASLNEQLFRRKPVPEMSAETGTDSGSSELVRSIGLFQLSMFGIGATIGTGIFFVLSQAVPEAGPAVIWSFLIAGVVAGLTAICYAELASAVPVSGSSYSYAYATLGELPAMGVAACLLLEYGVSAAAVAVGWSQYLNELFDNLFGFTIPDSLSQAPEQGGILNLPAVILIVLCSLLLIRGASESAKANAIIVTIKIGVLVMFIVLALQGFDSDNLKHIVPKGGDELQHVTTAAGIIFFSYIGLDAVSTAGEE